MSLKDDMIRYRAKNRLSQRELAQKCGLSLQTINTIENEVQTPSAVTVEKIRLVIGEEENV